MARSRELRGVVVPDVDDSALRRQVERPLSQVMDRIGQITPSLDIGGLGTQSSGGGSATGTSIQVAQLEALEDIHETLRGRDGGRGGNGGFLSGLGIGARVGGGSILGGLGGAGALAVGGSIGLGALLQDQFGEVSIWKLIDFQTSPGGLLANALTGGLAGASLGLGNLLLEGVGDVGEMLGLVEDAEAFERRLLSGINSSGDAFREWIDYGIRGIQNLSLPKSITDFEWPTLDLPDFSSLSLPPSIQQFIDVLSGEGGSGTQSRTVDLSEQASDSSLSFSERRLRQGALGERRRDGQSDTVRVDSPTLNADVSIDAENALNDLQRQVDRELRSLERQVSNLEEQLRNAGR